MEYTNEIVLRLTRHSILNPQAAPSASAEDIQIINASATRQLAELQRIFPDAQVQEMLDFNLTGDPVECINNILAKVEGKVVAIELVLPAHLIQPLLNPKNGFPIFIKALMTFGERRHDGMPPAPANFEKYQKSQKVEVIMIDL